MDTDTDFWSATPESLPQTIWARFLKLLKLAGLAR